MPNNNVLNHKQGCSPKLRNDVDRAKIVQLESLKSPDNLLTCIIFGPKRKAQYPKHFFCDTCDQWDSNPIENKKLN